MKGKSPHWIPALLLSWSYISLIFCLLIPRKVIALVKKEGLFLWLTLFWSYGWLSFLRWIWWNLPQNPWWCVCSAARAIAIHHILRTTVQYRLDVRQFNDFLGLLNENKSPLKCMENELRQWYYYLLNSTLQIFCIYEEEVNRNGNLCRGCKTACVWEDNLRVGLW